MATEVKLPRLGQGMESGTIVRWLKAEGDTVKKREPLYELDTDKVTQEVESDLDGVLLKIVVAEGEVEVGSTIAMIENGDGDDAGRGRRRCGRRGSPPGRRVHEAAAGAEAPSSGERPQRPPAGNGDAARAPGAKAGRRADQGIAAGPADRARAGVDLAALAGTGPDGRIVADDVENAPVGERGSRRSGGAARSGPSRGRGRDDDRRRARRSPAGSPRHGRRRSSSSASRST